MASPLRSTLARPLRRMLRPAPRHSVVTSAVPDRPEPLEHSRLFAVLGTWMEEDVVEATVKNAFSQGVERIYLVDNASSDQTVERAVGAGAVLAESFRTDSYQEHVRVLLMNSVVARVSLAEGDPHIWWLWLDADEFPEGPNGATIASYLSGLDRRFRVVGATYYNHFPTGEPAYLRGFHPVDTQPMCERYVREKPRFCAQQHFKHPLQRFDRSGPFAMSIIGFHSVNTLSGEPLLEPEGGIVTHHAQYRDEAVTRARMELLCEGDGRNSHNHEIGNTAIGKRFDSLDAVYSQRWGEVDNLRTRGPNRGVRPHPWDEPAANRWYTREELESARAKWVNDKGRSSLADVIAGRAR